MPVIPIIPTDSSAKVGYLIRLVGQLDAREIAIADIKQWRSYYAGDHDLLISDDQKAFLTGVVSDNEGSLPISNLCRVVVSKICARLNVIGWKSDTGDKRLLDEIEDATAEDQTATPLERVVGWWLDSEADRWEGEVYKDALRDAESYILVDYANGRPRLTVTPRFDGDYGIQMIYDDPLTRLNPIAAIKTWYTVDPTNVNLNGIARVTVYTSDAVRKYARLTTAAQAAQFTTRGVLGEDGFTPISDSKDEPWPIPWVDASGAPLGLAVVPFKSPRGSVIAGIIGLQDALNKTNLDMLATADQQGFGLFTATYPNGLPTVTAGADPSGDGFGLRPGRILETTATVSKLPADDMAGLLAFARHLTVSIASNSDIPLHEFVPTMQEVPSGAALEMLDGALADQATECCTWFSASWRAVMLLAQKLDALYGRSGLQAQRISPVWKETRRQAQMGAEAAKDAEAARIKVMTDAGIPLAVALQRAGWTKEQVTEVEEAKKAESDATQASLAKALIEAQRAADAGQNQSVYPQGAPQDGTPIQQAPVAQPGAQSARPD
jgi:hypothetical protein